MIVIDGKSLTIENTVAVARYNEAVSLSTDAKARLEKSRKTVEDALSKGQESYGINTGFGELESIVIDREKLSELQENLIHSHAATTGPILETDVVRAMLLHRANALARGYSGVRVEVVEAIIKMLNHGITPVVRAKGSLGASGDLAPLAHVALALTGKGKVFY
ncbi:MAG: aromatic amino acid lyase, partial [Candidatus Thermoplasmatota archaeon]|nr:aromatic amino acid lyase [Candidatus Thermoplasmatota archaeon]